MTTNQEGVHIAVRDITGTERSYNEDWHALFDSESIPAGSFNARMLAWINATLSASYTNLNEAMQAFAVEQGFANWASMNTFVAGSEAATFLRTYGPYGMVMNFADDASIAIKEASGVLDFTSQGQVSGGALVGPGAKLTYSAPSAKLTEQEDGLLKFQAHNLYLNSAAPANQSITVLSGASYAITITGSVSMVASGAATGTWTAGTTTFTAATGTLTLGSTSGSGTVHLRRTPSVDTYIATTSAAAYDLPYVYSGGVLQSILPEPAATNLFLNNRAPVTQNITTTAQTYTLSFYGTGSVTLSGTATATLNGTGANDRVRTTVTATAGTLTCTVSGTIDLVQVETGTVATSPIITYGAAVARAVDRIGINSNLIYSSATAHTIYIEGVIAYDPATAGANQYFHSAETDGANRSYTFLAPGVMYSQSRNAGSTDATASITNSLALGSPFKLAARYAANDVNLALNGILGTPDTSTVYTPVTSFNWPTGPLGGGGFRYSITKLAVFPVAQADSVLTGITA